MSGMPAAPEKKLRASAVRFVWQRVFHWRYTPRRIKFARRRDADLVERLQAGARLADAGHGVDTTGMSDDEFLKVLRRG